MTDPSAAECGAISNGFLIPVGVHRVEEVISRSRFLTTLAPAPSAEAAHEFIETVRAEFPDATHHCWAFVAGPPGTSASVGMSDDGEPHGTAGRPMLHALSHSEVGEVVAVCTRWYGGTKLGTGGLARAYRGGVMLALESLPTRRKVERVRLEVTVPYAFVDGLERMTERYDVAVDARHFADEATVTYRVARSDRERFELELQELTRGAARIRAPSVSASPKA